MTGGGYRRTLLRDVANTATLTEHLNNISLDVIACQAHGDGPENHGCRPGIGGNGNDERGGGTARTGYDLPIYASGGLTESKTPDIQAGFEKNFSNRKVAVVGADFIHLTAGMTDSGKSISYEQLAIDDENIGKMRRILRGITITEDAPAFDAIRRVGPGGHFVIEDHTLEHMSGLFHPNLSELCSFDVWETKDHPSMLKPAKLRVQQ